MSRRDSLLAALVASIWGFNFVVIDWGMGAGSDEIPPLLFLALRFTVVVVPAIFLLPKPAIPWRVIVAVGAFMSLGQFAFLYTAMAAGMPAGLAGLVLQAQVVLTIVIAAAVLRERPTRAQVAGARSAPPGWSWSGSVAAATCRCSRWASACSPRWRGRSATSSPGRPARPAVWR